MANTRTRCFVLFWFLLRAAACKQPSTMTACVLLTALFVSVVPSWGQGPMPGPQFAAEPVAPKSPEFCPPVAPAPLSRTPFIPCPDFVNAFDEQDSLPPPKYFSFTVGTIGLRRDGLGNGIIGVLSPPANIPGVPPNVDTGNFPPIDAPVAVTFNDLATNYQFGVRASFGVQHDRHIIEASGYYIPEQGDSGDVIAPGQLDLPFAVFPTPLGFEGNNNMWLQADIVSVQLETELANAELNYKYIWVPGLQLIGGVRYFDGKETFRIFTDDDGIVAEPPDPFRMATYQIETVNRIIGGQIGFQLEHYLTQNVSFGFTSKGMVGANYFEVENRLIRGDGFERTPGQRDDVQVSGLTELELFVNVGFHENIRLNAGYHTLWIYNVPVAHQQLNFDPNATMGTVNNNGTLFYHGPRVELQLVF
ncbi:MAG: BBP7 family outer membrane beta-barrel protein [Gemmataceae bacterium]